MPLDGAILFLRMLHCLSQVDTHGKHEVWLATWSYASHKDNAAHSAIGHQTMQGRLYPTLS